MELRRKARVGKKGGGWGEVWGILEREREKERREREIILVLHPEGLYHLSKGRDLPWPGIVSQLIRASSLYSKVAEQQAYVSPSLSLSKMEK